MKRLQSVWKSLCRHRNRCSSHLWMGLTSIVVSTPLKMRLFKLLKITSIRIRISLNEVVVSKIYSCMEHHAPMSGWERPHFWRTQEGQMTSNALRVNGIVLIQVPRAQRLAPATFSVIAKVQRCTYLTWIYKLPIKVSYPLKSVKKSHFKSYLSDQNIPGDK